MTRRELRELIERSWPGRWLHELIKAAGHVLAALGYVLGTLRLYWRRLRQRAMLPTLVLSLGWPVVLTAPTMAEMPIIPLPYVEGIVLAEAPTPWDFVIPGKLQKKLPVDGVRITVTLLTINTIVREEFQRIGYATELTGLNEPWYEGPAKWSVGDRCHLAWRAADYRLWFVPPDKQEPLRAAIERRLKTISPAYRVLIITEAQGGTGRHLHADDCALEGGTK